ncbi:hypothetical protein SPBR_03266 [Sporothrix brasiliensis 5110]|uniref:Uncharacterized protein n=1 Tax=Sporothrix brasiliensis 5110 TaxID=1398154 RepID=A0A0C2F1A2_9PEZI|nr:uncharacterized protein SPBR_03266 [Sporothrix brasiliensis 5110]KIH92649.1 hypothetical protein SPBR_03266 [Sporothrix brasiliensis 5110]
MAPIFSPPRSAKRSKDSLRPVAAGIPAKHALVRRSGVSSNRVSMDKGSRVSEVPLPAYANYYRERSASASPKIRSSSSASISPSRRFWTSSDSETNSHPISAASSPPPCEKAATTTSFKALESDRQNLARFTEYVELGYVAKRFSDTSEQWGYSPEQHIVTSKRHFELNELEKGFIEGMTQQDADRLFAAHALLDLSRGS